MRRLRLGLLILAAGVGTAGVAFAADGAPAGPPPSLEYKPPKQVVPEPKAPHPLPPITVFREVIGSLGIMTGSFDRPVDVARDDGGNFYVLDAGNSRVQKFNRFGNFVTAWGSSGSREEQFSNPSAIAYVRWDDRTEYLYVVDTGNNRIKVYDTAGGFKFMWGSLGSWKGDFKSPRDIAFDTERRKVYVLDSGNDRVQRFEPNGDTEPGLTFELNKGNLNDQVSIAFSQERFGYIYLFGKDCVIQQFRMGPDRYDATLDQSWAAIAPESGLCSPARIELDTKNNYLYALDSGNSLLLCYNPQNGGMFRWALRGATETFSKPLGFAISPDGGEVLIADTENNSVQKFTLR